MGAVAFTVSSGFYPSLEINLGKALTVATLGIVVLESETKEPF